MNKYQITEINDIMTISYKLDNIRCNLLDYCDQNKNLEDLVLKMQELVNTLIQKSWNLYDSHYEVNKQ